MFLDAMCYLIKLLNTMEVDGKWNKHKTLKADEELED